jgi:hypothetical protein
MNFKLAHVKAVKSDIVKQELTITLTVPMDQENMQTATELSRYAQADAGAVVVSVVPKQMSLRVPDGKE